jgi:hypothetical protein
MNHQPPWNLYATPSVDGLGEGFLITCVEYPIVGRTDALVEYLIFMAGDQGGIIVNLSQYSISSAAEPGISIASVHQSVLRQASIELSLLVAESYNQQIDAEKATALLPTLKTCSLEHFFSWVRSGHFAPEFEPIHKSIRSSAFRSFIGSMCISDLSSTF